MRPLLACLGICLILLNGCGEDEEVLTSASPVSVTPASVTPASTATEGTTTPSPVRRFGTPLPDFGQFREFARQIESAVQRADADFLLRDPIITTVDCGPFLGCATGTVSGISFGGWRSEATPYPIDTVRTNLSGFLASGGRLAAIAAIHSDLGGAIGGPASFAVLAAHPQGSAPERVLEFVLDGDSWRLKVVLETGSPEGPSEWLTGDCVEWCYDYWEPWQE